MFINVVFTVIVGAVCGVTCFIIGVRAGVGRKKHSDVKLDAIKEFLDKQPLKDELARVCFYEPYLDITALYTITSDVDVENISSYIKNRLVDIRGGKNV